MVRLMNFVGSFLAVSSLTASVRNLFSGDVVILIFLGLASGECP